jgi:acylphosphatase
VRAVHLTVAGQVQAVGFRAFVAREAMARGLAGWVRNRSDGSVEAVFAGAADAVEMMVAACRRGPPASVVTDMKIADYAGPPLTRFSVLPTA